MGQSRMENPEISTTLATQYTGQNMLEKTDGTIKNGKSRDIGNVGHTIHRTNKC
jgi:hypothetical protein